MCYVAALIAADSRSLAQKLLRQTFTIPTYIYIYICMCMCASFSEWCTDIDRATHSTPHPPDQGEMLTKGNRGFITGYGSVVTVLQIRTQAAPSDESPRRLSAGSHHPRCAMYLGMVAGLHVIRVLRRPGMACGRLR